MRRLIRRPFGRGQTASAKTSVLILGDRQTDTFEALCHLRGREPHQLAADMVLEAIREAETDHEVQELVSIHRQWILRRQGALPAGASFAPPVDFGDHEDGQP